MNIVPAIYFWLEEYGGKPTVMTAAVRWEGMNFGLSFPVNENATWRNIDKKKLLTHMREVVSVLVLHGRRVLDNFNQINPRLVGDEEAARWSLDPLWDKRVKAVEKLTKVKEITRDEAVRLELLDK